MATNRLQLTNLYILEFLTISNDFDLQQQINKAIIFQNICSPMFQILLMSPFPQNIFFSASCFCDYEPMCVIRSEQIVKSVLSLVHICILG